MISAGFENFEGIALDSREKIMSVQKDLLTRHLRYCRDNSPYYGEVLKNIDISFPGLAGISGLPFTSKSVLSSCNDKFIASGTEKIVDIVLTSGTTGSPCRIMYTENDLRRLAYNEKQALKGCGITNRDTVLLSCTMDRCFIAGLAYFMGIRSIGASAVRNGHNTFESHAEIIKTLEPTAIIGVPSFLKKLGRYLLDSGIDPAATKINKLICIGEPLRDKDLNALEITVELEDIWHAKTFSTYASSEIITTFCECTEGMGGHLIPELAIVEIISDKGEVLPPGETGEVVVTPLAVEGMPLIRFRTGDISFIIDETCSCGKTALRLGPVLGRKEHMMKIKGTTLYPQAVYSAVEGIDQISEYFMVVDSETELSESLTVHAAVNDPACTSELIQKRLQAKLRVTPSVILESNEKIKSKVFPAGARKPVRFIDRRK